VATSSSARVTCSHTNPWDANRCCCLPAAHDGGHHSPDGILRLNSNRGAHGARPFDARRQLMRMDDSPHPCAIHGSARAAERPDSTALSRRSLIRMRSLVQVQPGPPHRLDLREHSSVMSVTAAAAPELACAQRSKNASLPNCCCTAAPGEQATTRPQPGHGGAAGPLAPYPGRGGRAPLATVRWACLVPSCPERGRRPTASGS
jgi:hypothetical protein